MGEARSLILICWPRERGSKGERYVRKKVGRVCVWEREREREWVMEEGSFLPFLFLCSSSSSFSFPSFHIERGEGEGMMYRPVSSLTDGGVTSCGTHGGLSRKKRRRMIRGEEEREIGGSYQMMGRWWWTMGCSIERRCTIWGRGWGGGLRSRLQSHEKQGTLPLFLVLR